jgi:uroporphyrinogen decarboxylase
MNKREVIQRFLDSETSSPHIPAGFFIHFDEGSHRGQAAIDKHLEYFKFTGMDFVKIQYENTFPFVPEIRKAEDWAKMPLHGPDFYEDQFNIAKGLIDAAGKEAMVIMTLYSPFMCAEDTVGEEVVVQQLRENPDQVKKGIEIITESLMIFVKGCIDLGIDGFLHSTQGGETHRFECSPVFDECIKPYDLYLMEEINQSCEFNILHVCDYQGRYMDLAPFVDYPGHVINVGLELGSKTLTENEVAELFDRPFMGGLDRLGVIATGSKSEVKDAVSAVCQSVSGDFILGADCTLPGDVDWENIKIAIETAHMFTKG